MILYTDSEGPDQTARMRSLIWAFVARIWDKVRFITLRINRFIFLMDKNVAPAQDTWRCIDVHATLFQRRVPSGIHLTG